MNEQEISTEKQAPDACWYYAHEHEKIGPVSLEELRELIANGQLKSTDMLLQQGSTKWVGAATVTGLLASESKQEKQQDLRRFYLELRDIYRKLDPVDPKECLPILGERFEKRKISIRERRAPFLTDLARVFEKIAVDPKRHLHVLERRFVDWRAHTVKELRRCVGELPKDDPLCSAISLFGTMDLGRLERAHTKVLAWFLDPVKEHEFGFLLLNRLVRHLERNEHTGRLEVWSVESEKVIAGDQRLDVFVKGKLTDEGGKTNPWFMVIEAKIDAQEAENQLADYDEWIAKQLDSGTVTRVFLTPDGREGETSKEWKSLSFLDLACVFRGALIELQDKPGYHFLRYYLTGILKDVCRWDLPIRQPENCVDPYGFLDYMKSVQQARAKGEKR